MPLDGVIEAIDDCGVECDWKKKRNCNILGSELFEHGLHRAKTPPREDITLKQCEWGRGEKSPADAPREKFGMRLNPNASSHQSWLLHSGHNHKDTCF